MNVIEPEAGEKNPAEAIIDKFGGLTSLSKAYPMADGKPRPVTTVQSWRDRGRIPQDHWLGILEAGKRHGVSIEISEFLQVEATAA